MNETNYAKDITTESLHTLLEFWPSFSAEADEAQQMLIENKDRLLSNDAEPFA